MASKASKETMKEINEKLLLKEIYYRNGIDRATLAKKTRLSPATVTKLVGGLIEKNLVKETGVANSTGGRKPILLNINPKNNCIIGLKIGLGYLDFILTDILGNTLGTKRTTHDVVTPELVVSELKILWDSWRPKATGSLLGIGIAVSGVVDPKSGTVRNSYLLNWVDVPIGKMISDEFNIKTIVHNDVDSFALAQIWKGKAWKYANSVFVTLGVGVGGAISINGKLHSARGGVGEFGHMTVRLNGNQCTCGSKGCLEAEASFMVIAKKIYEETTSEKLKKLYSTVKTTESSEMEYLEKAIEEDPETMKAVFSEYSEVVGTALKNIINIFAPDYLLLGGEAMKFEEFFYNKTISFAKEKAFGGLADNLIFDRDEIGEYAWTYGCIYEIIEKELLTANSK